VVLAAVELAVFVVVESVAFAAVELVAVLVVILGLAESSQTLFVAAGAAAVSHFSKTPILNPIRHSLSKVSGPSGQKNLKLSLQMTRLVCRFQKKDQEKEDEKEDEREDDRLS